MQKTQAMGGLFKQTPRNYPLACRIIVLAPSTRLVLLFLVVKNSLMRQLQRCLYNLV
jgi:hypothetical protein